MGKLSKTTVVILAVMIGMLIFVTGCGRVEWECVKGDSAVTITGIKGGAQESPSGELKIPESIDGIAVRAIAPGAFRGYGKLTSVEIPPSVVSIGEDAFRDCAQLSFVQIPASVKEIGRYAFVGTGELKVKIQNGVTEIWTGAFCACHGLASVDIPPSVKSIGPYAFAYCEGLKSFEIPSSVSVIGQCAFISCTGLESLSIPRTVERVGDGAFKGCSGLTSLKFPQSQIVLGNGSFADCTALASVAIPLSVWPADSAARVFEGCKNLSRLEACWGASMYGSIGDNHTLVIPKGVTSIGGAGSTIGSYVFHACSRLESVEISEGVEEIPGCAFLCSGIKSVKVPSSLKCIGYAAFDGCDKLESVEIPEGFNEAIFRGRGIRSGVKFPYKDEDVGK